ncbi:MAG: lipoprotein [Legionella sp.]|nr:lipoprotein [Legionella sp.]
MKFVWCIVLSLLLSSCGQKGPLYLPAPEAPDSITSSK